MRFLIAVIAVVILLTGSAEGALTQPSNKTPAEIVHADKGALLQIINNFLDTLRKGDTVTAYNHYTSQQFQKNISLDNFKTLVAREPTLAQNKLFQHRSFYIEDEIVSFEGDLISTTGVAVPVEFDFLMEGNEWKIMGLQLYQPEGLTLPDNN
ncbi:MAG: DUF4864 domain-containing protein [Parachlamydiaceae bacterium]